MKLRCPYCRTAFPWDAKLPWPDRCPLPDCKEDISIPDRGDNGVVMPFIRSPKMKANDDVYRGIEAGSEQRVERAAELTGATKDEMSSLKITNMNDNMRAGDIAAQDASEAMKRLQASSPTPIGFQPNGAEFSAGISQGAVNVNGRVSTGIEPNAGARAAARVARRMQGF